jgi:hypothetical protein
MYQVKDELGYMWRHRILSKKPTDLRTIDAVDIQSSIFAIFISTAFISLRVPSGQGVLEQTATATYYDS